MNAITVNLYVIIAIMVAVVTIAAIIGATLAILLYERASSRMARYQRTGRPEAPTTAAGVTTVPGGEFQGQSIERQAQARAYHNVIENGARQMMELEPGLSLEDARRKAENALVELGAFKMGAGG